MIPQLSPLAARSQRAADGRLMSAAGKGRFLRESRDQFIARGDAAGIAGELAAAPSFRAQLRGVARYVLLTCGASLGRLIVDLDRYVAEDRRALLDRVPHPYTVIRPAFERAVAAGEIRTVDLDVVIPLYFAMIFAQIRGEAHGRPTPAPLDTLARSIADVTIDGIGAP